MNKNPKTILVVEDEDEISSSMHGILTKKGYRVLRAINADEALTVAEQDRPTMILTDLDLPMLDSMITRLRAHDSLKDMLVAVIDINQPASVDGIRILNNFDELDQLLSTANLESAEGPIEEFSAGSSCTRRT